MRWVRRGNTVAETITVLMVMALIASLVVPTFRAFRESSDSEAARLELLTVARSSLNLMQLGDEAEEAVTASAGKIGWDVNWSKAAVSDTYGELAAFHDTETLAMAMQTEAGDCVFSQQGNDTAPVTWRLNAPCTATVSYAARGPQGSTEGGFEVPGAPKITAAVPGDTDATITFTAPDYDGGDPVVSYSVIAVPADGGDAVTATAGGSPVVLRDLRNGIAYRVTVVAENGAGTGPESNPAVVIPTGAPARPTITGTSPANRAFGVSWNVAATMARPVDSFRIYVNGVFVASAGGQARSATIDSAQVPGGLTNGSSVSVEVSGVNASSGEGERSVAATATPRGTPGAPTITTAVTGSSSATISFTPPADDGGVAIASYTVTATTTGQVSRTATGTGSPITVTGLTAGSSYVVTVTAVNTAGTGPVSAPVTVTPLDVPNAPTITSAEAGNDNFTVTWTATATTARPIDGFRIYVDGSLATSASTSTRTVTVASADVPGGLTPGGSYAIQVAAYHATTGETASAPATVTIGGVPGAPTITATSRGDRNITVTFAAPADTGGGTISGYTVTATAAGQSTVTATGPGSPVTINGLAAGVTYALTVHATNIAGNGPASDPVNVEVLAVPAAPVITATNGSGGGFRVDWSFVVTAGAAATGFRIYVNDQLVATAGAAARTATVTSGDVPGGLTEGASVQVKVAAYNDAGAATSAPYGAVAGNVPAAPGSVTVTAGNGQAVVTFTAPDAHGYPVTSYTVTATAPGQPTVTATGSGSPITLNGLVNGQTYQVSVTATNAVGTSTASSASTTVTPVAKPAAPTITTLVAGDAQFTVAWAATATAAAPIDGFRIYVNGTLATTVSAATAATTVVSGDVNGGLSNGVPVTVQVAAYNTIAGESLSAPATTTTIGAPAAPVITALTPGNESFSVAWTATSSAAQPIDGFRVYVDGMQVQTVDGATRATTVVSVDVPGELTNGVSVAVQVESYNSTGAAASTSQFVTPRTVPTAPTNVNVTAGNTTATVTFGAPVSDGGSPVTSYTATATATGQTTRTVTGAGSPLTLTGLVNGVSYNVAVTSANIAGSGLATVVAVTPIGPAPAPTITALTPANQSFTITWTSNATAANPVTGYRVYVNGVLAKTVSAVSTSATVVSGDVTGGLANGSSYAVSMSSINNLPSETFTATQNVTPRTVPGAPTITSGSVAANQITVNFTPPADNGGSPITSYTATATAAGQQTKTATGSGSPLTITGLVNGVAYSVVVTGTNIAGSGATSNTYTGTPVAAPGTPTITSLTPGNTSFTVTWSATATAAQPIDGFRIYVDGVLAKTVTSATTSTTVVAADVAAGLDNGVAVSVQVAAYNNISGETASLAQNVTPRTVPGAPTIVKIQGGNKTMSVSFTPPVDNGGSPVTSYTATATASGQTTRSGSGTTSPISISNLTNSVTYTVTLTATNAAGTGPGASRDAMAGTLPGAPTISSVTPASGQLTVTFSTPTAGSAPITSYTATATAAGQTTRTVTGAASPLAITGLVNGVAYSVVVYATTLVGDGANSAAVNGTPAGVPGAPTITSVTAGNTQAVVAFAPPGSNGGSAVTSYTATATAAGQTTRTATGAGSPLTITGLVNGLEYQVTVTATNAIGTGDPSAASPVTPRGAPGAPTLVSLTPGDSQIVATFTAPASDGGSPITSYTATATAPGQTTVTATGAGSPLTLNGVANGVVWTVSVVATNAVADSAPSNTQTTTPRTVPGAPTLTAATAANSQVTVTFSAPVNNGGSAITSYTVTATAAGQTTKTVSGSTSPLTVTGLVNGVQYSLTAVSSNIAGDSAPSNTLTATPVAAPQTPVITALTPANQSFTGTWTATATAAQPIDGFRIYVNGTLAKTVSSATRSTTVTATDVAAGLPNGVPVSVQVAAYNTASGETASLTQNVTPRTVPGAPTITSVTAGNGQLSVAYVAPASDGGSPITGYTVTATATGQVTKTATGTTSPLVVTGLTNTVTYTLSLVATNAAGDSTPATSSGTPATVPGAPTITSVTPGNTQLSVAFNPPGSNGGAPITSYTATATAVGQATVTNSGSGSPILLTGLVNGVQYSVTVFATNSIGNGANSAAVNATPATVPGAPTITSITGGNRTFSVAFTAPSDNGGSPITGYTATATASGQTTRTGTGTTSPISIGTLTNGVLYTVTLTATNAIGTGPAASRDAMPGTLPGAPTISSVTPANAQLTVAFSTPTAGTGTITSYTATVTATGQPTVTVSGASSPITLTGLTNGVSYAATVYATTAVGNGPASAAVNGTPATIPGAPTITSVTAGNTTLAVAFSAPADNGGATITSYTATATAAGQTTRTATGAASPLTISSLAAGVSYSVVVYATNSIGNGPNSAASPGTPNGPPAAPTAVTVTPGNASLTLDFTPGAANGAAITSYTVTATAAGQTTQTASGSASPITVTSLVNGIQYTLSVTGTNSYGTSGASNTLTGTPRTVPGAPTITSVTPGNSQATVNFSAPASDGGSPITSYTATATAAGQTTRTGIGTGSPILISSLVNGVQYQVTVTATNAAGTGAASASSPVTPRTVPGAPTITSVTAGDGLLTVAFNPPASTGGATISSYTVTATANGQTTRTATGSGSPLAVSGLTNGVQYSVTVYASNIAGDGPTSTSSTGTPVGAPAAPVITTLTPGNAQFTVTWTATATTAQPIDGFRIYVNGTFAKTVTSATRSTTVLSSDVTGGLTNGVAVSVQVAAYNTTAGETASVAQNVTPRTVPNPPTITSCTPGNATMTIAFSTPSDGGSAITGYTVTATASGQTTRTATGSSSPLLLSPVTVGVVYSVTATATNAAGTSSASTAVNCTPGTVPGAPTITSVTSASGQLSVAYTAPTDNGGYTITSYTLTATASGQTTRTATGTTSPLTVTTVTNGVTYNLALVANNTAGSGPAATSTGIPGTVPGAPTISSVTAGNTQLTVAFSAPASNGGVAITSYTATATAAGQATKTATGAASPLVITGLLNGVQYAVTVYATNAIGNGANSASVNGTPASVPGAPTITSITGGSKTLSVAFMAPSDNGGSAITSYTATATASGQTTKTVSGSASPLLLSTLTNGVLYTVTLTATNAIGTGPAASRDAMPGTLPGAPTISSVTAGANQLTVAFSTPTAGTGTITSYTATATAAGQPTVTVTGAASPLTLTSLVNGVTYSVTVYATTAVGNGPASAAVNGTPGTAPGAPTITSVTPGNAQLSVAFNAPADNGGSAITSYTVTATASGQTTKTVSGAASPLTVTTLTNGVLYTVTVTATNAIGTGPASASATGTPAGTPGAPTITSTSGGTSTVTVNFSAPVTDGGSPILDYTATASASGQTTKTTTGATSPLTISTLPAGVLWTITVKARNANGTGPDSTSTTQATFGVPAAPTLASQSSGSTSITTAWNVTSTATNPVTSVVVTRTGTGTTSQTVTVAQAAAGVTFTGLTSATAYTISAYAVGDGGTSTTTSVNTGTAPAQIPVANITVTAKTASTLTWTIATPGTNTYYQTVILGNTYDSRTPTTDTWTIGTNVVMTKSGLSANTTYTAQFARCNAWGCSDLSTGVAGLTMLATPTANTATTSGTTVSGTWSSVSGATGYNLEWQRDTGGTGTAGQFSTPSWSQDLGVYSVRYQYRVQAVNGATNTSAWSAWTAYSAYTAPAAPTITATSLCGNSYQYCTTYTTTTGTTSSQMNETVINGNPTTANYLVLAVVSAGTGQSGNTSYTFTDTWKPSTGPGSTLGIRGYQSSNQVQGCNSAGCGPASASASIGYDWIVANSRLWYEFQDYWSGTIVSPTGYWPTTSYTYDWGYGDVYTGYPDYVQMNLYGYVRMPRRAQVCFMVMGDDSHYLLVGDARWGGTNNGYGFYKILDGAGTQQSGCAWVEPGLEVYVYMRHTELTGAASYTFSWQGPLGYQPWQWTTLTETWTRPS